MIKKFLMKKPRYFPKWNFRMCEDEAIKKLSDLESILLRGTPRQNRRVGRSLGERVFGKGNVMYHDPHPGAPAALPHFQAKKGFPETHIFLKDIIGALLPDWLIPFQLAHDAGLAGADWTQNLNDRTRAQSNRMQENFLDPDYDGPLPVSGLRF